MLMTPSEFKKRWESNDSGGGITFDDVADCAISWRITSRPRTQSIEQVLYRVLKTAGTIDSNEYKP